MRIAHQLLPYLPFIILGLAAVVATQHVYFYW
jgi:hypothetical protein